jgi:hypothetical protein
MKDYSIQQEKLNSYPFKIAKSLESVIPTGVCAVGGNEVERPAVARQHSRRLQVKPGGTRALAGNLWGEVAAMIGLPGAHFVAAVAALAAILIVMAKKLQANGEVVRMPSMHWPTPVYSHEVDNERGL